MLVVGTLEHAREDRPSNLAYVVICCRCKQRMLTARVSVHAPNSRAMIAQKHFNNYKRPQTDNQITAYCPGPLVIPETLLRRRTLPIGFAILAVHTGISFSGTCTTGNNLR